MNNFKKLLASVSATAIVATQAMSAVVYGATATFDPEFQPALNWMSTKGLTKYTSEDAYRPYDTLTREQAAKFFAEFAKASLNKTADATMSGCDFTDLDKADSTLKDAIVESCKLGLMKGSNGKFMPTAPFTKAAAITVLVRATSGMMDETVDPWWDNYFKKARELGLTKETNSRALDRSVLRGEIALMLYRAGNPTGSDTGTGSTGDDLTDLLNGLLNGGTGTGTTTTGSTNTGTGTTVTTGTSSTDTQIKAGNLEVALNPSSPAAQSVPSVGTVRFGKFDFRAGGSDVSLNSVKLYREGLGQRTDINRVWMEKNGVRITSRQTVGSDNSVIVTFSPALVVKANSTESIDLAVSLSGTSTNSQHRFSLVSANDVTSSASTIGGTYPVSTNYMTTSSYQVANVGFATGGTTSNYRVGDKSVELGQFKLQNNAANDMNVIFNSITLRNEGNGDIAKNLSNIAIYKNSTAISSGYTIDGKSITFKVNEDKVAFGRQETYYIRADINGVDNTAGDNYQFSLRYSDDITVVEDGTLFQTKITGADSTVTMSSYGVNGGDLVLSKNTSISSSQTVSPGSNDVVLLAADLKVSQGINLGDVTVSLNNGSSYSGTLANLASSFSSLKLKVGNNVVSTYTPASTSANSFTFEGNFTVTADTTVQVLGNVRTNATGKFLVNEIGYTNFATREYSSNGNAIQSNQFVGSVGGVVTTIGSASVTFTRNDGISNQSLVVGAKDRTLVQFVARANDVSDVTVTKLRFDRGAATSGAFNSTYVTNLRLYANDQLVSTKSMSAGNADFNDINVKIAKNSDITFRVLGDFSTSVGTGQTFQLSLTGNGIVEARDANSVSLTLNPMVNGPVYTFTNAGSASVSLNSSSPTSRLLSATGSEVEIARYTFTATDDSLRLTDLYLYNTGTADLSSRLKSISLYDTNGNKLAGGSIIGTGVASFSLGSTSSFIVPKNTSNSVLVVRAAFNDITSSIAGANTITLAVGTAYNVPASSIADGTTNGVRLVSESVGNTVTSITTTSSMSNTHLLVRSKPVVATSSTATNSTHTFTVTADANNRIFLTGLTLNVSIPAGGPQNFVLYKDSESVGNDISSGTFGVTSGSSYSSGSFGINFNDGLEISAGSTRTFVLVVSNLAGTPAVNSKRIIRVTDMKYVDKMDTGSDDLISSVAAYSNVGLPSAESTFTY